MAGVGFITALQEMAALAVIEACGAIVRADEAFCDMLGRREVDLRGENLLDFTAPADRERCVEIMARFLDDPRPVTTTKRIIGPSGTHFWVRSRLSLVEESGDPPLYEIAIERAAAPNGAVEPAKLLAFARIIHASRCGRRMVFDTDMFTDHAWDILIVTYIREAEGQIVTIAELHAEIGISLAAASRWLRALAASGLIEYEDGGSTALVTAPFRLSAKGHQRFETFLTQTYRAFELREKIVMS